MIKLPVEQFSLFPVRKPAVIAEESGLGQQAWPKPPSLRAVRVFSDDFVATGTLLLSELVFRDLGWNGERNIDDDAGDVLVGIGENVVAIGTVCLPDPDGPVRVGWWPGRSLVAGVASGRGVAGGVGIAASFVILVVFLRIVVLWLLSSTTLFAGWCVGVFVPLEAVFQLLDSFVLVGILLTKKRVLSEKSEIPLTKGRPTRRTDRRGQTTRRSVRLGKHDYWPFVLLFPESYDFELAAPLNRYHHMHGSEKRS